MISTQKTSKLTMVLLGYSIIFSVHRHIKVKKNPCAL